ncbi:hypothetical protein ABK046_52565, partial [Streptomyces caeruleatus]
HKNIRVKEQELALEYLKLHGGFILNCKWGYGKLGFISSFLSDAFKHNLLRVDLADSKTKDDIEQKFKSDIGVDFTYL